MKSLLMIVALMVILENQCEAQTSTATQSQHSTEIGYAPLYPEEETDLRTMRFGEREISLAAQLRNSELQVKNDDLEDQLTQLKGETNDSPRSAVDRYLLEEDKIAIDIARRFEIIWSYRGTKDMQHEMLDPEKNFDSTVQSCFPDKDTMEKSVDEIKANCASLHEIDIVTSKYQFKGVVTPSVFKENIIGKPTIAQRLLREDTLRMKADTAAYQPRQIRTQLHSVDQSIKEFRQSQISALELLLSVDQSIIDWDKEIRLAELSALRITKHNNAHPESPEADGSGVISILVTTRQKLAETNSQYRRDIAKLHK